ncbi:MAG: methylmalonyl-CoA mutase [Candidatus Marinimicrobia bacterium]|nr:methylmalonyl-CoA mutase [Candidatus Neomarinimicrobiota bacterium]|tara:strand:+ start:54 stop:458 length:405 start_codon:yes stop_codon:yes gene_type:complete
MNRPIRILMAKPGLDGHDRGIKILARAYRDAGMEVIYLGLRQTPSMIVSAAIQEDVDVIAISVLSGAHMTIFPKILELLNKEGINDILLTGGGIIPQNDMDELKKIGVGQLFGPGTPVKDSLEYIVSWFNKNKD